MPSTAPIFRPSALAVALLFAGAASSVLAQDNPGDPGAGVPTGAPPAAISPVIPGSFNYQNAPVNSILDTYEQLSGMHLVRDANLAGVPPVSLNATGLSKPEMLKLIRAVLILNGISIQPIDAKTEKVVTVGTNKNPRSEGLTIYTRLSDLPDTDQVVTFYMPLNYINPQEAVGIFTQTAPVHTYGAYVPAPSAQGVVVTEEASVVRELAALKDLIDIPPAKVTTIFIQLERADSDKIADTLNKMLGLGPNGAPAANAGAGGQVLVPPTLGNSEPLSNEKNLISGPATIISDPRSNRLVITTRPVNLPFIQQVVAQLDQPDIFTIPQRHALRYVIASDILPALEAAIAQGKDEEDEVKKDQQAAQSSSQAKSGGGGASSPAPSANNNEGSSSGGTGSATAITPALTQPAENDVPTVVTVGKTRLMADNRSNSIIVFGSPDIVGRVFSMIDQLDQKPLQVYLRTVIGSLTLSEDKQFGVDLLQKFQKIGQGGLATSNLNSSAAGSTVAGPSTVGNNSFPNPATLGSNGAFAGNLLSATGFTIYGAIGSTLDAYVSALESTDRFKIISTPSVYTSNNKLAIIANGQQIPVPSNITSGFTGSTSSNGLTTTASVSYEDVLLQLDIIPLINAEKEVTLQVRQTNNTTNGSVSISGNSVPIIATQEINTEVTVKNKQTVVIGGLIRDTTERNAQGLPWLSDIPVLGYLFGAVDKAKKRDELIIMIQPTVVETEADQIAVDETQKQRTILGQEAVEAAEGAAASQPVAMPLSPGAIDTGNAGATLSVPSGEPGSPYNSKGIHYRNDTSAGSVTAPAPTAAPVSALTSPPTPPVAIPGQKPTASPDVQYGALPPVNPPKPTPTTAP
jgi:type II secretion system protein D